MSAIDLLANSFAPMSGRMRSRKFRLSFNFCFCPIRMARLVFILPVATVADSLFKSDATISSLITKMKYKNNKSLAESVSMA